MEVITVQSNDCNLTDTENTAAQIRPRYQVSTSWLVARQQSQVKSPEHKTPPIHRQQERKQNHVTRRSDKRWIPHSTTKPSGSEEYNTSASMLLRVSIRSGPNNPKDQASSKPKFPSTKHAVQQIPPEAKNEQTKHSTVTHIFFLTMSTSYMVLIHCIKVFSESNEAMAN